mmetsp:Transcript_28655/g.70581  ORF Transcript_28655/g.70581 Transcript_28655/m.70581 type:complete len:216 (-) Transcript_28655:82-729(-)
MSMCSTASSTTTKLSRDAAGQSPYTAQGMSASAGGRTPASSMSAGATKHSSVGVESSRSAMVESGESTANHLSARTCAPPSQSVPIGAARCVNTSAHVAAARAVADGQPAVRPNEFTYAELMRAQLRAGCPRRVGELLALAEAANAGRPLKTRTLNLGVRAHCAQGALRPALRLVVRMRGLGVRTDAHARHALAALCAARGQYALASRLAAGEVA